MIYNFIWKNTSTLLVLAFKTTIHFKKGKYWIFLEQTLLLQERISTFHSKAYELTNLIVDTFSKLLVFSGNQENRQSTAFEDGR